VVAHDLHPDYASTQYALSRAECERDATLAAVQHHHAHMASCMAEHDLDETVIGVTFDGAGLGTDGTIWGGEFLIGDYRWFRRAAHLRPVGLPGGDRAAREPWRMAAAQLIDSGCGLALLAPRRSPASLRTAERMLERRFNTPLTSSAGRLFDAVAALAGVRDHASYEGQAAMELEWLATPLPRDGHYPFEIGQPQDCPGAAGPDPLIVDVRPLIRSIVGEVQRNVDAAIISRRFHSTVAEIIAAVCIRLRRATGVDAAVLSGGVFMNALLAEEASARLDDEGFRVYRHRLVPCNDGGLSLGQLAVAAGRLRQEPSEDDRHVSCNTR
jgi:hydrogenase maturation protein HypF